METIYDKLIRDEIPTIIKNNGATPFVRTLSEEKYLEYLLKKDSEELEEVKHAQSSEERKKNCLIN